MYLISNNIKLLAGVSVKVRSFSFAPQLIVRSDLPFFIGISNSIYYANNKSKCKSSEQ